MDAQPLQPGAVRGIVFDAFGTLLRIGHRRQPFLQLMKLARAAGRRPRTDDARQLMVENLGLAAAAEHFQVPLQSRQLAELEQDLFQELASVRLYPDALPAIERLQGAGLRVAVCSNLAAPYAIPVQLLLPGLDAYCWSFAVGAIKPEPAIYAQVAQQLGCPVDSLAMIGDTLDADCLGPRRCGLHGFHLQRGTAVTPGSFNDLTSFAQFVLDQRSPRLQRETVE
ncbi:HAD family hydrolase [Pseudomonas aeruginosa]